MPTREDMQELVDAHASLDEPMTTAIWIHREDRDAWLVELIPSFSGDEHPERPVLFNPGLTFRFPLHLIASDRDGLERAMQADPALARAIAEGVILYGPECGRELQELARQAHGNAQAG